MSWKIYCAFKVEGLSHAALLNFLKRLRVEYLKRSASILATLLDEDIAKVKKGVSIDLTKKLEEMLSSQTREPGHLAAEVSVFLHRDEMYVMFFNLDDPALTHPYRDFFSILSRREYFKRHFKNFEYYDNSDEQLNHMTRKEWRARKKKWDTLLKAGTPAESAYTYTLLSPSDVWKMRLTLIG